MLEILQRLDGTEVFAALMGFICVLLNIRANIWAWFFGILSIVPYIFVFYQVGLYGDFALHIFFLIANFYGIWHWLYGGKGNQVDSLPITKSQPAMLGIGLVLSLIGMLLFGYASSLIETASLPYIDAYIAIFSVWGQILLARKKIENWLVWIIVDIVAIGVYFHKDLYATSLLYTLYLFMASYGYWQWRKKIQKT
jgi:nicotinamide mononucleotide transporter